MAVLAAVTAGCGGQKALPEHAGMNEWDARERAMEYLRREVISEDSPLYGRKPRFMTIRQGQNSEGEDAWVVRFRDSQSGTTFCLNLWAQTALNVRQYTAEWDRC